MYLLYDSPQDSVFSGGFFTVARVRLGHSGRRRGSARARRALARGLDVGIYDAYIRHLRAFPALSVIRRNASLQGQCLMVIPSGGALRPPVPRERWPPAGAALVRTCAGDRTVEIYYFEVNVSHARHVLANPRFRCDDA